MPGWPMPGWPARPGRGAQHNNRHTASSCSPTGAEAVRRPESSPCCSPRGWPFRPRRPRSATRGALSARWPGCTPPAPRGPSAVRDRPGDARRAGRGQRGDRGAVARALRAFRHQPAGRHALRRRPGRPAAGGLTAARPALRPPALPSGTLARPARRPPRWPLTPGL